MPYDVVAFSTDESALTWTLEEEGAFHRLLRHAWCNGGLPDNTGLLAQICRCDTKTFDRIWLTLEPRWPVEKSTGRRKNQKQELERQYVRAKAEAGKLGARSRWKSANGTTRKSAISTTRKSAISTTRKSAISTTAGGANGPHPIPSIQDPSLKHSPNTGDGSTLEHGPEQSPGAEREPPKKAANRDPAADIFMQRYERKMHASYASSAKDFVQLANLRKANHLGGKEVPPDWEIAVDNFLASPISEISLADLARRYPIFKNSRLDAYKVPVNHENAKRSRYERSRTEFNMEEAAKLRARLDTESGSGSEREDQRGDTGPLPRSANVSDRGGN